MSHKQQLDENGQPIMDPKMKCAHGIIGDYRGNRACESCFDNALSSSFANGTESGWKASVGFLTRLSGLAFEEGRDSEAQLLRRVAGSLKDELRQREENAKGLREVYETERVATKP